MNDRSGFIKIANNLEPGEYEKKIEKDKIQAIKTIQESEFFCLLGFQSTPDGKSISTILCNGSNKQNIKSILESSEELKTYLTRIMDNNNIN